jgi:uncharacterized protein YdeI (YjbR/CyaY-like superfamily)
MNPKVDLYLADGCGRCALYATPQCKVIPWQKELAALRAIVLDCGLTEELKWGVPCYTFQDGNIAIVSAFKAYCSVSFFKGVLLQDTHGILVQQGEHAQAARLLKFTHIQEIIAQESIIKTYIYEAIEVEKAGLKVEFKKNPEPIPEEFQRKMNENLALKTAFEALTPGRQRGYILHFSQPKQAKSREARVEKCMARILSGKGLND